MTTHTLPPHVRDLTPAVLLSAAWFVVVFVAAVAGAFRTSGDGPPVAVALAVVVPPAIAVWRALRSERFRAWARSLDLAFLTLLQSWRVVGIAFLALAATGSLPGGFAVPAGLGDLAIGVTAPLVALYVVGRGRAGRRIYLAWAALGILDLVVAVALGVLYSESRVGLLSADVGTGLMQDLPMILIPAFGVPLALVLHVIALVNLTGGTVLGRPA